MADFTVLNLQEQLCKEIENITSHMGFKTPLGKQAKIKCFRQSLPIIRNDGETECFPWIIVRLAGGEHEGAEASKVSVLIVIGIFDSDPENQGIKDVLNIIHTIYERFAKKPVLNGEFIMEDSFRWAIPEEEAYPYFFGEITMTFDTAAIRRENKYL